MRLASSGDKFCARTDMELTGIQGVFKLVDDIIIFGNTKLQLLDRIKAVFTHCQDNRITLSNSKHQIGSKVKFACHLISDKGTKPDLDKIAVIKEFPEPTNVTDL